MTREYEQDPEIALALAYVSAAHRAAAEAIFALDAQMGHVVRTTTEPMIGAMRLTWWRDSVEALAEEKEPSEPLLQLLWAQSRGGRGIDPKRLAMLAEGWIALLDPMPLERGSLEEFARLRGGILFTELGSVLGGRDWAPLEMAGRGWALADFAFHCSDQQTATMALELAGASLRDALETRWPVALRPLGMLAQLARRDAQAGFGTERRQGSPARMFRALRYRITGR